MRRRKLKKLWARRHELQGMNIPRDALLLKLGAVRQDAGRAWDLVEVRLPAPGEGVCPQTFHFRLDRARLRRVRRSEGTCLLRTNLNAAAPEAPWKRKCSANL